MKKNISNILNAIDGLEIGGNKGPRISISAVSFKKLLKAAEKVSKK